MARACGTRSAPAARPRGLVRRLGRSSFRRCAKCRGDLLGWDVGDRPSIHCGKVPRSPLATWGTARSIRCGLRGVDAAAFYPGYISFRNSSEIEIARGAVGYLFGSPVAAAASGLSVGSQRCYACPLSLLLAGRLDTYEAVLQRVSTAALAGLLAVLLEISKIFVETHTAALDDAIGSAGAGIGAALGVLVGAQWNITSLTTRNPPF